MISSDQPWLFALFFTQRKKPVQALFPAPAASLLESGNLLFSRAVPRQVPSAARVFTCVFGMGTRVSHGRIVTGNLMARLFYLFMSYRRTDPFAALAKAPKTKQQLLQTLTCLPLERR